MMADENSDEKVHGPGYTGEKTSGAEAWEQKRRLARAMRLVIERLVPSNAPEAELRAAAATKSTLGASHPCFTPSKSASH